MKAGPTVEAGAEFVGFPLGVAYARVRVEDAAETGEEY